MAEETPDQKPLKTTEPTGYGAVHPGGPPQALIPSKEEEKKGVFVDWVRPCICEFLLMAIYVFIGTMTDANLGLTIGMCMAHGLTIAILMVSFGEISGGHINPAITFSIAITGGMKRALAVPYVICQCAGAIFGAALTRGILGNDIYESIGGGIMEINEKFSIAEGFLCETCLCVILIMVVLQTRVDGFNPTAPFAIGFTVSVLILSSTNITGGCMNPARAFGPAIVVWALDSQWTHHWLYWVAPACGSILAVTMYKLIFGNKQNRFVEWGEK